MTLHLPRAARRAAWGVVMALSMAAPLAAAPATYLSVEDLARRSDACVVARVVDSRVHWNDARTLIVTTFTLDVEEDLMGDLPTGPLTLHRVGGELDGRALEYQGMPRLDVGERAAVFLLERAPGRFIVAGLSQGLLRERGELFVRDFRELLAAPAPGEELALDTLRRRLTSAKRGAP